MNQSIKDFCERFNITEEQFYGREEIKGNLFLYNNRLTSLPEGFNPTVGGSLYLNNNQLTSLPDGFNPTVGGSLFLNGNRLTSLPDGFNPTVGGGLFLNGNRLTSLPDGFNPTVGGSLFLHNNQLTSLPEGFNPTVGGDLYLHNNQLTSLPEGFNPTVGGDLYLYNNRLTSLPDGFNPTVGGNLYLYGNRLTSLPDGFNPTVGGDLYLSGNQLTSLPEGFNPTVGGNLYLYGNRLTSLPEFKKLQPEFTFTWQNGKYIKADGIFMEVVSRKGNVYKVRKINNQEVSYLITDGKGKWSHGSTLKEAKNDLIYKISSRSKDEFNDLTLDSELSFEEAIEAYRLITGACSFGVRDFIENRLKEKKDKYRISEIIKLTKGEYGSGSFESFFKK